MHASTHTHTHTHVRAQTHTWMHTHTCTHAHTHTHTHTHTQTTTEESAESGQVSGRKFQQENSQHHFQTQTSNKIQVPRVPDLHDAKRCLRKMRPIRWMSLVVVFLSRELLRSMKLHLVTEDSTVGAAQNMQSQDIITQAQQETQLLDEDVTVSLVGIKPHSCRKVTKL